LALLKTTLFVVDLGAGLEFTESNPFPTLLGPVDLKTATTVEDAGVFTSFEVVVELVLAVVAL